jgi:hypothetical protein
MINAARAVFIEPTNTKLAKNCIANKLSTRFEGRLRGTRNHRRLMTCGEVGLIFGARFGCQATPPNWAWEVVKLAAAIQFRIERA